MLLNVNILNVHGILSKDLVPFLWPASQESSSFWDFIRDENSIERVLWPHNFVTNQNQSDCAMALLEGFDLILRIGSDFLVPGALAPTKLPKQPIVDVALCPFRIEYKFAALASGAFEALLVRSAKIYGPPLDFSAVTATFCDVNEHLAQILRYKEDSIGMFEAECLVIRSSCEDMFLKIKNEVARIEAIYPGLSSRIKILIICGIRQKLGHYLPSLITTVAAAVREK